MELREYWHIIRRRLHIVITPFLVVLVLSLLFRPARAPAFQASMRFMLGLEPEARSGDYYAYDKYYTWLTAEYLVDDAAELVRSSAFAEAVSGELEGSGITIHPGAIQGSTQAGQLHRILTVSIVWGDPDQLGAIANAVVGVLPVEIARHFAQVGTGGVAASLIDPPAIGPLGASLRDKLDIPLRLVLALFAGLGLAFVLHYLDNTVRQRLELEQDGIQVLAEIPPHARGLGLLHKRLP
jgi:capsular polysaccharide biosynthesis protein